ncbi:class I SAM-dependent methyltransferase [Agromyces sp. NPDC058110]|uniref:class I SAM-dependent methyltransferase n=1 Tax=Agromyces sp. NPDC058110 TaxID=3346345 RepID=UPI0036DDBC80
MLERIRLRRRPSAVDRHDAVLAALASLRGDLSDVRGRLDALDAAIAALPVDELTELRKSTLPAVVATTRRVVARADHDGYEQFVAWTELREHLGVPAPFMPSLRGWAVSPDALRVLVRLIDEIRPALVVECGSGASSVWLGYALRRTGGRLVALEHDVEYAERSRRLVDEHGLGDVVEVRAAPLEAWQAAPGAPSQPWYDLSVLHDLSGIGLVFVDGPPAATGVEARYPAVPALFDRCAPGAAFVLDDAARDDERAVGERWLAEFPALVLERMPAEKGLDVFTVTASPSA